MAITGNQYENHKTDPARPVQLRLIKDEETGELRKKTMSERYNRNITHKRSKLFAITVNTPIKRHFPKTFKMVLT